MIYSMTGFGRAVSTADNKKITIELRSLNSKQTDINLRLPSAYKEKEIIFRNLIAQKLFRGKIDAGIYVEWISGESNYKINNELFLNYYNQLKALENDIDTAKPDYIQVISKFPDVLKAEQQSVSEQEWEILQNTLLAAIEELNAFRKQEGAVLEKILTQGIEQILKLLTQIPDYEEERTAKIKQKIIDNFSKKEIAYDENRLEQELIFYIEKLDISEEKVRLQNHCHYFTETMQNEFPCGKKLGFIAQEIGREINTMGSKANHHEIQKIVVQMKDELEKIKEQILNIL